MASYLRPRRGKKATAIAQLTASAPLKRGEVFFEVPDGGTGTGKGKIKMGDGTTAYESLPYFLEDFDPDSATVGFTNATAAESDPYASNTTHASAIVPTANLKTIFTNLKQLLLNYNSQLTTLNNDLTNINNSLVANSKHFYFDYKNGKYGYNTNPNRGADTFVPFKNGFDCEIFFIDQDLLFIANKCYLIANGEINIVTESEATTISELMDISVPNYVYVKAKKKCKMTVYSNDNVVSNINETIVNAGQTVAQFGATEKYNCFIIAENI